MAPRLKLLCMALLATACMGLLCCQPAHALPGSTLVDAPAAALQPAVAPEPSDGAAPQLDEGALERDCPNFGFAYMLGVLAGRCKDVDDYASACICRTVCPLCADGSPSAAACRHQLRCGDVSYWRHGNATLEGYLTNGLAYY